MKKEPINFEEKKRIYKKLISAIGIFFCVAIVSLYVFAWVKGANLKSIFVSGSIVFGVTISFLIFLYLRIIKQLRKDADCLPVLENRNTRLNYFQYSWVFASVFFAFLGLIVIFVKKMFLFGFILEVIGGVLIIIWSKLLLPKKPS